MSLKLNSRERPKSTACLGEEDNHIKLGELLMFREINTDTNTELYKMFLTNV